MGGIVGAHGDGVHWGQVVGEAERGLDAGGVLAGTLQEDAWVERFPQRVVGVAAERAHAPYRLRFPPVGKGLGGVQRAGADGEPRPDHEDGRTGHRGVDQIGERGRVP